MTATLMSRPRLPQPDELYRALLARDPSYDGLFVVGVKTTRVFCRPTCPARKPMARNVEFFATTSEAQAAGYRACRRCRPLERPGEHPAWVRQVLHLLDDERDNNGVIVEQLAALLVERFGITSGARLEFALNIAVETADALIKMAFRRDPDGDPLVIDEAKALIREYLHRHVR